MSEEKTECHCEEWCFCGVFCEIHVPKVVKAVGKVMLMVLDPQNIGTDERCMVVDCGKHVQFMAFKDANWETKHE